MSLNHILGTARKLGIPVVITNDRGESAQVVMPFEDFASMVNGPQPLPARKSKCRNCVCEDMDIEDDDTPLIDELEDEMEDWSEESDDEEGTYELTPEEIEELDRIIVEDEQITTEPANSPKESKESKEPKEVIEPTNVSIEDQFYFEPLQDKE